MALVRTSSGTLARMKFRDVELADLQLKGPRLVLRRWSPDDAQRVADVMRDGALTRWLALPDPYTVDDARAFVGRIGSGFGGGFGNESRDAGTGLGCAAVERSTGRIAGSCELRLTGDPEIGYWVAPDAQGNGYAAEMTRVLAGCAFDVGLHRVRLACDVRNVASAATALRAGFRFEGVSRGAVTSPGHRGSPDRTGELARFGRVAGDPSEPVAPAFPRLPATGLTDGTIRLRVLDAGDAAAYAETEDAESLRWNFTGAAEGVQRLTAVAERAPLDWLVGSTAHFAIVDEASAAFAGEIMLRKVGPPQVGGIGYTVHPAFRGRGYTTRALRLLASWAFEQAGFARLELGAKTGNVASQRAAANAGFVREGVQRCRLRNSDGTFSDEVCFELISPALERSS